MADDPTQAKPRPRRRRTDIDPNAPSPPVANERRRRRKPVPRPADPVMAEAIAASPPEREPEPAPEPERVEVETPVEADVPRAHEATAFHVPGMASAALGDVTPSGPSRSDEVGGDEAIEEDDRDDVDGMAATAVASTARPSWLAVLDDRSPDPTVCPFLRSATRNGLAAPIESPNPTNRCAALTEAVPQSLRQQELVCLTTGHVNCPRYLRGAAVMTETPVVAVREGRAMSPAMLGSLVVLVMALTASVAFVLARGGALDIGPAASPIASFPVAVVSPSPATPVPVVSPSAVAQATPTPTPEPTPTATPTPEPTPEPTPRPTPRPQPTSDRYQLLDACPDAPRCWIYTVRSGDNLYSIARYFGVSMDSIYARNPWLRDTGLRAGQRLRLPPPTR